MKAIAEDRENGIDSYAPSRRCKAIGIEKEEMINNPQQLHVVKKNYIHNLLIWELRTEISD